MYERVKYRALNKGFSLTLINYLHASYQHTELTQLEMSIFDMGSEIKKDT